MATRISSVKIEGFRSLANVEISGIGDTAVMIGANGSGKSNIMRFFEMVSWMLRARKLDEFVQRQGGADDQLYRGNAVTPRLKAEISLTADAGLNDYKFTLTHAHPNRFVFTDEAFRFTRFEWEKAPNWQHLSSGHSEARIVEASQQSVSNDVNPVTARTILYLLTQCAVYQFHNTSDTSNFKISWDTGDNNVLRSHGGNLPAILHRLEQEDIRRFDYVQENIRRILPAFDRFEIEENYGKVALRWKAKGSDKTIGAHLTSDGSLRFFALVTLLNLPPAMLPNVLLLDEPELGLHPAAVALVSGMIDSLSRDRQTIVATQSPLLVDAFDLDRIFVLEFEDGRTQVKRLDPENYRNWLEDGFAPGELWQKNLLGGRP